MTPRKFRNLVFRHYRAHGRHTLPWRTTHDPYKILVSEVMLQQTQVDRVIPLYRAFLKLFPTVSMLAEAPLGSVLRAWQGLGYNRRAKMLHAAAKVVVGEYGGRMPRTPKELETLPGIGPYTAGAIAAFAYNHDSIFIETNIRTAVTHHFFPNAVSVADSEVLDILAAAYPKGEAREWYAALMDYGAYLKRSGVRLNAKRKGYTKQSLFKGSSREARGALLKELSKGEQTKERLFGVLGVDRTEQVQEQLEKLVTEGFIKKHRNQYRLAD